MGFGIAGVIFFLVLFSYWLSIDMVPVWSILIAIPVLFLFFILSFINGRKVVGKKDPVLEEMKGLEGHEELDLSQKDELELKELRPNYDEEDFV